MILIDALYLHSPGGLTLLKLLIRGLENKNAENVFYLLDIRSKDHFTGISSGNCIFMASSIANRKKFYVHRKDDFNCVLCFSNLPPPIRLDAMVFSLFHNILWLQDCPQQSFISRVMSALKMSYAKHLKINSDFWIVQTELMQHLLSKRLSIPQSKVMVIPVFDDSISLSPVKSVKIENSFIYPATGLKHKNHRVLFGAWEMLPVEGPRPELHLTIDSTDKPNISRINSLTSKGLKIINHGLMSHDELTELYNNIEFLVYPSLNESFGLPLIEGIQHGCEVLVADLPYFTGTVIPAAMFDPHNTDSLKKAIVQVISGKNKSQISRIVAVNKTDTLIGLLTQYNKIVS